MARLKNRYIILSWTFIALIEVLSAQESAPTCGTLITHDVKSAIFGERQVQVWLPPDYSKEKAYSVIYAMDGQMLFDSSITWNNQSWHLDRAICSLKNVSQIPSDVILVAIPNAGKFRHSEYFPQKILTEMTQSERNYIMNSRRLDGSLVFNGEIYSDDFARFVALELKSEIGGKYSTVQPDSKHYLIGSSMGALISLYILLEYPHLFDGAACLSTHWPGIFHFDEQNPFPKFFLSYFAQKTPFLHRHKLYFDLGTETLDAHYLSYQQAIDTLLKQFQPKGLQWESRIFEGADHSEKSWAARVHLPLVFLLQ